MAEPCAVILAAGAGSRMKANRPKVLSPVLFKPMIEWVIDSCRNAGIRDICVITGFMRESVEEYVGRLDGDFTFVEQEKLLGTGHAVMMAEEYLREREEKDVIVLCGDAPFINEHLIRHSYFEHLREKNASTVITANFDNPKGYGRIIRNDDGSLQKIVEDKDASFDERMVTEINSGTYWFQIKPLLSVLGKITNDNTQGEYYLPDAIRLIIGEGGRAGAILADDPKTTRGANDCLQLQQLNDMARFELLNKHMLSGVDCPCIEGVIIGPDVKIGTGVTILPGTILRGHTVIGNNTTIGPNSVITDCEVGDWVTLNQVQCTRAKILDSVSAGPFVHIRPGSVIANDVHIGDFVEIKNSSIGERTKVPHFSYLGDSDIGSGINFGCGSVTANYDGKVKSRCVVEDDAFIGCNTTLVAPVRVGNGSYIAAGTTVTEDVPPHSLTIGRSRQINKEDYFAE